ncbi:ADP/ATP carrier protein [Scheffersomyces stipitis CBS 6054]|uniref:Mitochondrial thiamine pyrophosphate carrier 1 n=1 Tax=Scheffersomyces stipitis (strain ATCC 58785 / CBS 6054 / NBRC 10063 / NRRL Y-11545) TaxID=322104 RepID=A3LQK5_PICST|nr:ADP/ATP carrier protein [Scheffersomyces stipitis CBS 6054]ABN64700.1 ADP/ATP carrier protein [Scheffersomyces stipitis CBS 6054]
MSLTPLEKAASGALASVIANTLVYPLDLSKTLIQTQVKKHPHKTGADIPTPPSDSDIEDSVYKQKETKSGELKYKNTLDVLRKIYAKKGVLGWYHGLFSSILGTAAQNFSYFYWYTIVKRVYANLYKHIPNHRASTLTELFLGAVAAAISQMFTMPIGVVTTQQQTDKSHKNLLQLTQDILEEDGVSGLWRGLRVSLVLCINPSITYGSYERLKQVFYGSKEFLGPLESFSIGVLAKSLATVATQPLIVSKAMLQKKSKTKKEAGKPKPKPEHEDDEDDDDDDIRFDSFTHALAHLWHTERFRGLYKGIAPQLLKGVFVQGLLFMFKDQLDIFFLFLLSLLKKKKGIASR